MQVHLSHLFRYSNRFCLRQFPNYIETAVVLLNLCYSSLVGPVEYTSDLENVVSHVHQNLSSSNLKVGVSLLLLDGKEYTPLWYSQVIICLVDVYDMTDGRV